MGNKNAEVNSLSNISSDELDLDFNIEEVEQVIAPQVGDDSRDDLSVTESRRIWCC